MDVGDPILENLEKPPNRGREQGSMSAKEKKERELLKIQEGYDTGNL